MVKRLFSDTELEQMGTRTLDRLLSAIEDGDTANSKLLAQKMYNEFLSQHDGYRNWVTALLSEIGRRFGDSVLDEVMTETVKSWWLPNLAAMEEGSKGDLSIKAKMFAAGLRGHMQPMSVEEDDEKITLKMKPCGSGGRLVLEGKYDGPDGFLKVSTPQKMTYDRSDFPVYCAHEAAMEQIDIEQNGSPFVVVEPSKDLGKEPCSFIIYKDPGDVPDKYYDRLGLTKPTKTSAGKTGSGTKE